MSQRKSAAKKSSGKSSDAKASRNAGESANSAERHNPEQGSRAIDGEVEEDAVDSAPVGVDVGSAKQLPGAEGYERRESGVPAPTKENGPVNLDDDKSVQSYRDRVHEAAEETRAQGTGAEPPRFNKGATD